MVRTTSSHRLPKRMAVGFLEALTMAVCGAALASRASASGATATEQGEIDET